MRGDKRGDPAYWFLTKPTFLRARLGSKVVHRPDHVPQPPVVVPDLDSGEEEAEVLLLDSDDVSSLCDADEVEALEQAANAADRPPELELQGLQRGVTPVETVEEEEDDAVKDEKDEKDEQEEKDEKDEKDERDVQEEKDEGGGYIEGLVEEFSTEVKPSTRESIPTREFIREEEAVSAAIRQPAH